jgi:nitrogen-specific signal transduction histidine kinase
LSHREVNVHPVLEDTLKLVRNELRHRARLSASHAIVTSLGGTLRAESEPGAATRFIVTLPTA